MILLNEPAPILLAHQNDFIQNRHLHAKPTWTHIPFLQKDVLLPFLCQHPENQKRWRPCIMIKPACFGFKRNTQGGICFAPHKKSDSLTDVSTEDYLIEKRTQPKATKKQDVIKKHIDVCTVACTMYIHISLYINH